jgi:lambda family phage portal protein
MAPGMLSLHHLAGFMLSAVMAAEHGANHYGFFKTADGAPPIGGEDAETGAQITTTQPGTFDTLPIGVDFTPFSSPYPNETFGPFVKTALQRVATGWRVAYVSLANDLEGVNYSSIRQGVIEERDRWTSDQEWFISTVMEPVFKEWLRLALLSGAITMPNGSKLPAAKLAKFSAHEWQARRWEWVDPKGDIEAKILMVKAGLMSPQDLAAAMGYDFLDTVKAIALAKEVAARYGVTLPAYDAAPGATPAPGQPAAQPTEPAKTGA